MSVPYIDINEDGSRLPNRGILFGRLLKKVIPAERKLEGIVSAEMEVWLQQIWDQYDLNSDSKDITVLQNFKEIKAFRDDQHRQVIRDLYELMENISGDPAAELDQFIATFGLANFGRYSAERLFDQHVQWKAGNLSDVNLLVIAARCGDNSGAFDNLTRPFEDDNVPNVLVFELASDATQIIATVQNVVAKGGQLRTVVLSGHGDVATGIPDLGIDAKASELGTLSTQLRLLSPRQRPVIILDSCLTGADNGVGYSLAQQISRVVTNTEVIAPDKVIFSTDIDDGAIKFDNKSRRTGKHVLHKLEWEKNEETGELEPVFSEIHTALKGSLVRADAKAYVNGELINTPGTGHIPSRVVTSMSPPPVPPPSF